MFVAKKIYSCEYDWVTLNETLLPEKEDFYNHVNMKDIANANYETQKENVKILIWNIWINIMTILLLPDVFKNFQNMSWNICTWSCSFSSASGLALEAVFKKTKVKLELLTGINLTCCY